MEVFDLIRTADLFSALSDFFAVLALYSFLGVIVSFAGVQTSDDEPGKLKNFKRVLIGSCITYVLAILFCAITPNGSTYYSEAKYKLYQNESVSTEQREQLTKYLDEKISDRKVF